MESDFCSKLSLLSPLNSNAIVSHVTWVIDALKEVDKFKSSHPTGVGCVAALEDNGKVASLYAFLIS